MQLAPAICTAGWQVSTLLRCWPAERYVLTRPPARPPAAHYTGTRGPTAALSAGLFFFGAVGLVGLRAFNSYQQGFESSHAAPRASVLGARKLSAPSA